MAVKHEAKAARNNGVAVYTCAVDIQLAFLRSLSLCRHQKSRQNESGGSVKKENVAASQPSGGIGAAAVNGEAISESGNIVLFYYMVKNWRKRKQ